MLADIKDNFDFCVKGKQFTKFSLTFHNFKQTYWNFVQLTFKRKANSCCDVNDDKVSNLIENWKDVTKKYYQHAKKYNVNNMDSIHIVRLCRR